MESATWGAFVILALSVLVFGSLIVRRNALPRWLGGLAIVSAVLSLSVFAFWITGIFGVMGTMLWLIFTGGWIAVRGTQEAAREQIPQEVPFEKTPA